MEVPNGFVALNDAVDQAGRAMFGSVWEPANRERYQQIVFNPRSNADPNLETVMKLIAEACQAGTLASAYQDVFKGAEKLDCGKWQISHWRNYFVDGTVAVDELPSRPQRKVFIRTDSLTAFVATLPALRTNPQQPKRGPKARTLKRVVAAMRLAIQSGKITEKSLEALTEKHLAAEYSASRDTVRKARRIVLSKLPEITLG